MPCTLTDDTKFSRLRDVFNRYFEEWLVSVKQGDGNFSRKEKKSNITFTITVNSITSGSNTFRIKSDTF